MKTIFSVWAIVSLCIPLVVSQNKYDSDHLSQDVYHDSEDTEHYPNSREPQPPTSYEYESHDNAQSGDPRHYQSLEPKHHQPKAYSTQYFRQYHDTPHHDTRSHDIPHHDTLSHDIPHHEPDIPHVQPEYYGNPDHIQYNQPEDPSYHKPQEIEYHQPVQNKQDDAPKHEESYHGSANYHKPEIVKEDDSHYKSEEPKYSQAPTHSSPPHRGIVPVDPKLPLYFTMYEKRTIQDPLNKYGKGPWRYLTYGHGISYGTKGPGKVFEKGYGYIRALGRDHCKLPEHLCPPTNEKPFEYEGRKEPYFGYRPH